MDTTAPLAEPLLTAAEEVDLALDIEAGLLAADALARNLRPHQATVDECASWSRPVSGHAAATSSRICDWSRWWPVRPAYAPG